jgi:hypothetical protein
MESKKLKRFQKKLSIFDVILSVSPNDTQYLKRKFPKNKVFLLPSFHQNIELIKLGKTKEYALYVGNLGVAENIKAVDFLIDEVFSKIKYPFIIAGLNPSNQLKNKIRLYSHIQLQENLTNSEIDQLYKEAHINLLITFQDTGLKLKLLNALYQGGFCICNNEMVKNTGLEELCNIANSSSEIIEQITLLQKEHFSEEKLQKRRNVLQEKYSNIVNIQRLIQIIWD